jgi:hypothetical protein
VTHALAAQVLAREDVWRHFAPVLDNLLAVCSVTDVASWQQLQAFLTAFAARRPGEPCPLPQVFSMSCSLGRCP